MGYKKYSPFLKSVKILILLSLMYFTTRLDAVNLRIPVTAKEFDYHSLPVYCKPSTRHFECKDDNGTVYCLPDSMKCRIKCANDAELKCKYTVTRCQTGEFRCSGAGEKAVCISQHSLCDGLAHCPNGEDEHASLCNSRSCGAGQFACRSPGHCLPDSKRCDGKFDCLRPGLEDRSDEEGCVQRRLTASVVCSAREFRCSDGSKCIDDVFVCDGVRDCGDGSDETGCQVVCGNGQLKCDGKCLPPSARCDGKLDCSSGEDEADCRYQQCRFSSEMYCGYSKKCISSINSCDGHDDCGRGEDEVCPISHQVCRRSSHWTCKSGQHCVLNSSRCDGAQHCPDGSDEANCPKPPTPTPAACPAGQHLCNGTNGHCVLLWDACLGRASCPQPDAELQAACSLLRNSTSPCRVDNGGCEQDCQAAVVDHKLVSRCSCRRGWRPDPQHPRSCVDEDECSQFGSCSQLCRNRPGGFDCDCRPGYSRHGNRCSAPGAAKILFSTDSGVEFVDTDTGRRETLLGGLLYPKYLAVDTVDGRVFFHTRDGGVGYVGIDGAGRRLLMRDAVLDAVAYDWHRKLLFYSVPRAAGRSFGHVGVMNVTNGARARLRTLDCPRGLAVHPQAGHLYVSLWCGRQPGVYRMALDGSQLQLVSGGQSSAPGHLSLDLAARPQRLYWSDAGLRAILSCRLDGGDLRAHWRLEPRRPGVPFDVAVFADRLYFNDLQLGLVQWTERLDAGRPALTLARARHAMSVAVYHSLLQPPAERPLAACSCQHICLAQPPAATGGGGGGGRPSVCLCDDRYSRDADGRCVNGTALERRLDGDGDGDGERRTSTTTLASDRKVRRPAPTSVSSIAGVAISAIVACFVVGGAVAALCLRRQDKRLPDAPFHAFGNAFARHEARMPKVNSRTPLTDCEVGLDKF